MNVLDVAWSDSQQQWVVREPRLRWVGDVIPVREIESGHAHRVAAAANRLKLGKDANLDKLVSWYYVP
jgi:hypothetical protein